MDERHGKVAGHSSAGGLLIQTLNNLFLPSDSATHKNMVESDPMKKLCANIYDE